MSAALPRPLPIAVLISGGGTTLKNLLDRIDSGQLSASVAAVVSSSATARGIRFAEQLGIPVHITTAPVADSESFREDVFGPCREAGAELVVMGGFLKHVLIPPDFANRVVNIHPSLIPAFCGKGYYGRRVHQAVLDYGAKVSGCTVHFVDDHYDHGPIILQRTVPVLTDDTADTLGARVFAEECRALPDAIQLYADGGLSVEGRTVVVRV